MALWYYLSKGRPSGPITANEIRQQIEAGHIRAKDLLYQDKDTEWREAQQFADFKNHFDKPKKSAVPPPEATPGVSSEPLWVLLSRKLDGSGYRQKGPYTQSQIVKMLKSNEVSFTDYVWREGLKEWYKVIALPDFHKPLSEDSVTFKLKDLPPLPVEDAEMKWQEITKNIPLPEEAKENLPPKLNIGVKKIRPGRQHKDKSVEITARRTPFWRLVAEIKAIKKTTYVLVILGLFIGIILSVVAISTYVDFKKSLTDDLTQTKRPPQKSANVPTKAPAQPTPPAKPTAVAVVSPPPRAEPSGQKQAEAKPADIKVPPQYVRLRLQEVGKDDAKIVVDTNASGHYSVRLYFTALGGEVLNYPSFYRMFRLRKIEERTVELNKLGIPKGNYQVLADVEGLTTEVEVAFGTLSSEFTKELRAYRKQILYTHNDERFQYVKTTGRLEKEVLKLSQNVDNSSNLNSWTSFYRAWRKNFERIQNPTLSKIGAKSRNSYVHADRWLRLKELRVAIDNEAKSLNRDRLKGEKISSQRAKELARELGKEKEAMIQASLWK